MFAATDTPWAPWYVAHSDDKKRARLNVITHLLDVIPYQPLAKRKVSLPKRDVHETSHPHGATPPPRSIPTPF